MQSINYQQQFSMGPDTCNEEIYAPHFADSMIDLEGLIPQDELYNSLMTYEEDTQNLPPTFNLEGTSVFPDLLPFDSSSYTDLSVLPGSLPLDNETSQIHHHHTFEEEDFENMQPQTKRQKKPKDLSDDPKHSKRLEANKKSAQASRERKKALKVELEGRIEVLEKDNIEMRTLMTSLETENKVLKNEFILLQKLIGDSTAKAGNYNYSMEKLASKYGLKLKSPSAASTFYLLLLISSFGQQFNNVSKLNQKRNDLNPLPVSVKSL